MNFRKRIASNSIKPLLRISAAVCRSLREFERDTVTAIMIANIDAVGHFQRVRQLAIFVTDDEERVEVIQLVKRLPPDFSAQQFWLKNYRPED